MSADADRAEGRDRGQRWSALLGLLAEHGRLSVADASRLLAVSEATVRRDFTVRLPSSWRPGLMAASWRRRSSMTCPLATRARRRTERRNASRPRRPTWLRWAPWWASTAARRRAPSPGDLAARADLATPPTGPAVTVVSNALNIASEMVLRPFVRCVSLGGVARAESYEQTGPLATMVLEQLWLDIVILGVGGLSAVWGASCDHEGEAGINAVMVQRADRVVVVATGDKVGHRTFALICAATDVDELVTDSTAPAPEVEALRAAGVDVTVV